MKSGFQNQQNSRLSFFSKSGFQGAERESYAKNGQFAVYFKIASGIDLVGTIKKKNLLHCEGIDDMVTAEKLWLIKTYWYLMYVVESDGVCF